MKDKPLIQLSLLQSLGLLVLMGLAIVLFMATRQRGNSKEESKNSRRN